MVERLLPAVGRQGSGMTTPPQSSPSQSRLIVRQRRYELAFHTDQRWRIFDAEWVGYCGLPDKSAPEGHRTLMFTTAHEAEKWLKRCCDAGLDMFLPRGHRGVPPASYERFRQEYG